MVSAATSVREAANRFIHGSVKRVVTSPDRSDKRFGGYDALSAETTPTNTVRRRRLIPEDLADRSVVVVVK